MVIEVTHNPSHFNIATIIVVVGRFTIIEYRILGFTISFLVRRLVNNYYLACAASDLIEVVIHGGASFLIQKVLGFAKKEKYFQEIESQLFFTLDFLPLFHPNRAPTNVPPYFLSNFGTTLLRWMCWQIQHAEEAKIYCGQNSFEFPSSKYYTVRDASSSTKKVYFKYRSRAYKSCKKSLKYVVCTTPMLSTYKIAKRGRTLSGIFFIREKNPP